MAKMHIHISVDDLKQSINFYSALFGAGPSKVKPDYAKWMLNEQKVNFAISQRNRKAGIDHLGLQAESEQELAQLRERIKQADITTFDDGKTVCCYAASDKTWVKDPSGVAWETYHTMAEAEVYGAKSENEQSKSACSVSKSMSDTGEKSSCC